MDSVVYYAALMGVDESILEAAEVDGATNYKKTIYVILPTLVPLITILTILKIGNIFRADFGLFYQISRDTGTLYSTTDVIDTYVYRTLMESNNVSLSTAIGFITVLGLSSSIDNANN